MGHNNRRKKDLKTNIFRKLNNLKIKQCYLCLLKQLAGQIKKIVSCTTYYKSFERIMRLFS